MNGRIGSVLAGLGRSRTGAAMIEFTLVLPMLAFLSLSVAEFGRALHHNHVINKGVRDGARFLARVPVTCPPSAVTGSIDDPNDVTRARNLAMNGYVAGGMPILSYWTDPLTVSVDVGCVDNTTGTFRGGAGLPVITVSVSLPYQDLGVLGIFGFGPITFTANHEQLHIGE
jgi:Flp pilus assembly protein TadG